MNIALNVIRQPRFTDLQNIPSIYPFDAQYKKSLLDIVKEYLGGGIPLSEIIKYKASASLSAKSSTILWGVVPKYDTFKSLAQRTKYDSKTFIFSFESQGLLLIGTHCEISHSFFGRSESIAIWTLSHNNAFIPKKDIMKIIMINKISYSKILIYIKGFTYPLVIMIPVWYGCKLYHFLNYRHLIKSGVIKKMYA